MGIAESQCIGVGRVKLAGFGQCIGVGRVKLASFGQCIGVGRVKVASFGQCIGVGRDCGIAGAVRGTGNAVRGARNTERGTGNAVRGARNTERGTGNAVRGARDTERGARSGRRDRDGDDSCALGASMVPACSPCQGQAGTLASLGSYAKRSATVSSSRRFACSSGSEPAGRFASL